MVEAVSGEMFTLSEEERELVENARLYGADLSEVAELVDLIDRLVADASRRTVRTVTPTNPAGCGNGCTVSPFTGYVFTDGSCPAHPLPTPEDA